MKRSQRRLQQLNQTVQMKIAVLEKQKEDIKEVIDDYTSQIVDNINHHLHKGLELMHDPKQGYDIIQRLDKASQVLSELAIKLDSILDADVNTLDFANENGDAVNKDEPFLFEKQDQVFISNVSKHECEAEQRSVQINDGKQGQLYKEDQTEQQPRSNNRQHIKEELNEQHVEHNSLQEEDGIYDQKRQKHHEKLVHDQQEGNDQVQEKCVTISQEQKHPEKLFQEQQEVNTQKEDENMTLNQEHQKRQMHHEKLFQEQQKGNTQGEDEDMTLIQENQESEKHHVKHFKAQQETIKHRHFKLDSVTYPDSDFTRRPVVQNLLQDVVEQGNLKSVQSSPDSQKAETVPSSVASSPSSQVPAASPLSAASASLNTSLVDENTVTYDFGSSTLSGSSSCQHLVMQQLFEPSYSPLYTPYSNFLEPYAETRPLTPPFLPLQTGPSFYNNAVYYGEPFYNNPRISFDHSPSSVMCDTYGRILPAIQIAGPLRNISSTVPVLPAFSHSPEYSVNRHSYCGNNIPKKPDIPYPWTTLHQNVDGFPMMRGNLPTVNQINPENNTLTMLNIIPHGQQPYITMVPDFPPFGPASTERGEVIPRVSDVYSHISGCPDTVSNLSVSSSTLQDLPAIIMPVSLPALNKEIEEHDKSEQSCQLHHQTAQAPEHVPAMSEVSISGPENSLKKTLLTFSDHESNQRNNNENSQPLKGTSLTFPMSRIFLQSLPMKRNTKSSSGQARNLEELIKKVEKNIRDKSADWSINRNSESMYQDQVITTSHISDLSVSREDDGLKETANKLQATPRNEGNIKEERKVELYTSQVSSTCMTISPVQLDKDSIFPAIIINLTHPWSFYVQRVGSVEVISRSARHAVETGSSKSVIPHEGLFCLTKCEFNYCRAKILSLKKQDGQVTGVNVLCIDYGIRKVVSPADVYSIPDSLTHYPCQAIFCALQKAGPKNAGYFWTDEAISEFQLCTKDKQINVRVVHPSPFDDKIQTLFPHIVDIMFLMPVGSEAPQEGNLLRSMATHLIKKGLAKVMTEEDHITALSDMYVEAYYQLSTVVDGHLYTLGRVMKCSPVEFKKSETLNVYSEHIKSRQSIDRSQLLLSRKDAGMEISVMISAVISPTSFFIHLVDKDFVHKFETLEHKLHSLSSSTLKKLSSSSSFSVARYSLVCAVCSEDGFFYRGLVLETDPPNNVDGHSTQVVLSDKQLLIFFIDYGDFEWVHHTKVFPMPSELKNLSPLVLWCSLESIEPKGAGSVQDSEAARPLLWSVDVVNKFKSMVCGRKVLSAVLSEDSLQEINIVTSFQCKPVPVMLLDRNVNGEEICVNHELIQLNLASLRQPASELDQPIIDSMDGQEWDPMTSDYMSIRNSYRVDTDEPGVALMGYNADNVGKEGQKVCVYFNRPKGCFKGERCPNLHVTADLSDVPYGKVPVQVFEEDQTDLLPEPGSKVLVAVSQVISPSLFYVTLPWGHLSLEQIGNEDSPACREYLREETLESMMDNMCEYYKSSHYDGDLMLPAPGQAVAAKVQDQWLRAKVIDMDVENCLIKVMSVDFGFVVWVKERDLRELSLQFLHLTPQAVKCSLVDVEPQTKNGDWKEETCEKFAAMTSGKELVALVTHRYPTGHISVVLYDNSETPGISLNQRLVDCGLASCSASTGAVDRKSPAENYT